MRKGFLLVVCLAMLLPTVGNAGFRYGPSQWCAVDDDGGTDWFWYCGSQDTGCDGVKDGAKDHNVWLTDATDKYTMGTLVQGDPEGYTKYTSWTFYWEGNYAACCGGDGGGPGVLKSYNGTWLKQVTKDVGGGTCTYYTNPCGTKFNANGDRVDGACDVPDTCPEGQLLGEIAGQVHCICPEGEGFDGPYSSECVSCATTPTQGIDKKGVCIKCSDGQLFNADRVVNGDVCAGKDCCVTKNRLPIGQHASFEWCWRCNQDKELWLRCLSGGLSGDDDFQNCGVKTNIPSNLKVNLE